MLLFPTISSKKAGIQLLNSIGALFLTTETRLSDLPVKKAIDQWNESDPRVNGMSSLSTCFETATDFFSELIQKGFQLDMNVWQFVRINLSFTKKISKGVFGHSLQEFPLPVEQQSLRPQQKDRDYEFRLSPRKPTAAFTATPFLR